MARRKAGAARDGLNIILVGCGKVGVSLVEKLSQEGHNITVVDRQAAALSAVTDLYDVSGVVGNGASYRVQQEAGIDEADILISVTASDELNLLIGGSKAAYYLARRLLAVGVQVRIIEADMARCGNWRCGIIC